MAHALAHESQDDQGDSSPVVWTPSLLQHVSTNFEHATPAEIIRWAASSFPEGLTLGTSFGVSGMALIDQALQVCPDLDIFYVDTGLFFEETYDLIQRAESFFGRSFRVVRPELSVTEQNAQHGDALWSSNSDACCHIRKVVPLRKAVSGKTAWMTALRRDQSTTRANTPIVTWNRSFQLAKIAPLANWTERDVWRYVIERNIPYNALHDQNYPSIGCAPCTRPANANGDLRSGRWNGSEKTECGIHLAL